MKKVMADIVSGVFAVTSFDDFDGCEVMSQEDFVSNLKTLSDDETIGAELDEETTKKIDSEYGIH